MMRLVLAFVVLAGCSRNDPKPAALPPSVPTPNHPGDPARADPLAPHVIPPELVMEHQAKIGLRPEQQQQLVKLIQTTQSTMVDLQWRMTSARDALIASLAGDDVVEATVLERADALFALEREVKRAQMTLVVRVRDVLSAEQRTRLRELVKK